MSARRNCWTCAKERGKRLHECGPFDDNDAEVVGWLAEQWVEPGTGRRPVKDADGCPGYEGRQP